MLGLIEGSLDESGRAAFQLIEAIIEDMTHVGIPGGCGIATEHHPYQAVSAAPCRCHQIEA